jgi:hypothetical protein
MMADRRGTRRRLAVEPVGFEHAEENFLRGLACTFGFSGDVFSDDPEAGAGPSAIASTLASPDRAKLRLGKLNASFADSHMWDAVSPSTQMAVTLLGDKDRGPVLAFVDTEAGQRAAPRHRFGTEALHIVVEGSCRIGHKIYHAGDMRIQDADAWCEPVEALGGRLKEVIVLGDRRYLNAESASEGWPYRLSKMAELLRDRLSNGLKAA